MSAGLAPSIASRAISSWQRFWFTPIPPHIYAVLRIGFGLSGLAMLLIRADLSALWDLQGFVPMDRGWTGLKAWLAANDPTGLAGRVVFLVCLTTFVAMTLGAWSRVTVPLSFAGAMLQYGWNDLPMSGADAALRAFLFCLIWTDCGAVWSVDAWRARRGFEGARLRRPQWPVIAPLRLIRFQLALIYLSAGLWKLQSPLWRDGSALYYVLNSNVFRRFPYAVPTNVEWLTTLATYGTLFWELSFAPMVLFRSTRSLALFTGALIHLGMFATMEVGAFHLVMLASYVAFLDPNKVPDLPRRLSHLDNERRKEEPNEEHYRLSQTHRLSVNLPGIVRELLSEGRWGG